MVALDDIDVVTMNGNPAKAFQWFGLKPAKARAAAKHIQIFVFVCRFLCLNISAFEIVLEPSQTQDGVFRKTGIYQIMYKVS